ncbi:hypothetical protein BZA77DRAFT_100199 [Pyronema omphalodes]|nr:hypothetical protein BZA77DRAFT_100199 [Pyronema omphalodes]
MVESEASNPIPKNDTEEDLRDDLKNALRVNETDKLEDDSSPVDSSSSESEELELEPKTIKEEDRDAMALVDELLEGLGGFSGSGSSTEQKIQSQPDSPSQPSQPSLSGSMTELDIQAPESTGNIEEALPSYPEPFQSPGVNVQVREIGSNETSSDGASSDGASSDGNTGGLILSESSSTHQEQPAETLQQTTPSNESSESDPEVTRPSSSRSNYTEPEITVRHGNQPGPSTNSLSGVLKHKPQNMHENYQLQVHLERAIREIETAKPDTQKMSAKEKWFDPREYEAQELDSDSTDRDELAQKNSELNKICPYVEDPKADIKKKDKHITWGKDQVKTFDKDEALLKRDRASSDEEEESFQMDEELSDTDLSDMELSDEIMADIYGETVYKEFLERQNELLRNSIPQSQKPMSTPETPPIKKADNSQFPEPMETDSEEDESAPRYVPTVLGIPSFTILDEDNLENTDAMQVDSQHTEFFQDETLSDDEGAPLCRMPSNRSRKDTNETLMDLDVSSIMVTNPSSNNTAIEADSQCMNLGYPKKKDEKSTKQETLDIKKSKSNAGNLFSVDLALSKYKDASLSPKSNQKVREDADIAHPPPAPRPSFKSINKTLSSFTPSHTLKAQAKEPEDKPSDCHGVKQFHNPELVRSMLQGRQLPLILVRLACSRGHTKGQIRFHPLYNWDLTAPPPKNLMSAIYMQEELSATHAWARVMHDPVIKDKVIDLNESPESVFSRIEKWAEETYGRKWLGYEGVRGNGACCDLWGNWIVESFEEVEDELDVMVTDYSWHIYETFSDADV